jgi:hypothetical protein
VSSPPETPLARTRALARALADRGLTVDVEEAGPLAILVPTPGAAVDWPAVRSHVVRLARDLGFSNVALELP